MNLERWKANLVYICVLMLLFFLTKECKAQESTLVRVAHDSFISYYDTQLLEPVLVCYVLQYSDFSGHEKVSGRHFKMDTKLPRPRVKDSDIAGTGYVRGHLCSAADRDSRKSWLKETYLTSNLCPMTMVCNSGRWKVIEDSCRAIAKRGHRLIIARGPLFKDIPSRSARVIQNRLAIRVPDGFFSAARCLECGLCYFDFCENGQQLETPVRNTDSSGQPRVYDNRGTEVLQLVIQARYVVQDSVSYYWRDPRILNILRNVTGVWSREEYETITR